MQSGDVTDMNVVIVIVVVEMFLLHMLCLCHLMTCAVRL